MFPTLPSQSTSCSMVCCVLFYCFFFVCFLFHFYWFVGVCGCVNCDFAKLMFGFLLWMLTSFNLFSMDCNVCLFFFLIAKLSWKASWCLLVASHKHTEKKTHHKKLKTGIHIWNKSQLILPMSNYYEMWQKN